jgi:phage-related minor tail protein
VLELSTLVFKVETGALDTAIKKHKELAAIQRELGKPSNTPKSSNRGGGSGEGKQLDLLTKLDNLYKDLAQGATRWEASQLRAARQMGVPLESVKEQLLGIRKLSQDPFDSAIGSVRSITQYFEQLNNRVSLANEGLLLTAKQLREFSRIPFEVEGQMKAGGKSPKDTDNGEYLRRIQQEEKSYIGTAKAANQLASAEKGRSDVIKQHANANKFLAAEMQRVDAVLGEMNSTYGLNVKTQQKSAEQAANYAANLKRAGVEGQRAAVLMEDYRKKISQIADIDKKRAGERLSNALAPQISDVAVSLAGGMPLHLVMMQQGLQIRDLIGQSKIDVKDLDAVFRKSMSNMVTSIGGTVAALGSLAYGGLKDVGSAVSDFGIKWSGLGLGLDAIVRKFPALAGGISVAATALGVFTGGLMVGAIVLIGALVMEYVKLIGANDTLVRSLAVTGGVFGVAASRSAAYVEGLTKVGATTLDAIAIIGQMADSGKFTASQIDLVGKAAVDMERYGGVAIKDTIKAFEDMAKDPVKGLTELAIKTGDVSPKTLQLAYDLQEQGKMADAATVAVKALAGQMVSSTERMQHALHPLTKMWIDLKHTVSGVWSYIGNVINKSMNVGPEIQKTRDAIENIKSIQKGTGGLLTMLAPKDYMQKELDSLVTKLAIMDRIDQTEVHGQKLRSESAIQIKKNEEDELTYMSKKEKARRELDKLEKAKAAPGSKISDGAYLEKKNELEGQLVDKGARAESNKQKTYELSVQEKINDAYNQMVGNARELTVLEKKLLDIRDDPKFKNYSPKEKAAVEEQVRLLNEKAKAELKVKSDADVRLKEQKESEKEMADLYRELSIHGEKYEQVLLNIAKARANGAVTTDEEADRLRKENLRKNSNAYKFGEKTKEDQQKSGVSLQAQEEDLYLRQSMVGRTELAQQKMQEEFNTEKSLKEAMAELDANLLAVSTGAEIGAREELEAGWIEHYSKRIALIEGEAALKRTLLSEEEERRKNFDAVVKRGFESMGDALVDFALTGKSSFGDMIKQMLIDLAKVEIKMQMMKLYNSAGGYSGILKSLAGMFSGSNYEGGGYTGSSSRSGGVDGKGGFPAILHPKEVVTDLTRQGIPSRSSGGSNVQIIVNNNSGQQVEKKESVDSRGNRRVELTIGEMTAGEMSRVGSSMQGSVSNTFGLRPTLVPR